MGKSVCTRVNKLCRKVYTAFRSLTGSIIVLVLFNLFGAIIFVHLEAQNEQEEHKKVRLDAIAKHAKLIQFLSNLTSLLNNTDLEYLNVETESLIGQYQTESNVSLPVLWNFWKSMFFCGTIYTTIGYGNIYPKTDAGKIVAIFYAVFGIPIAMKVLAEIGTKLTSVLRCFCILVQRHCLHKGNRRNSRYSFTRKLKDESDQLARDKAKKNGHDKLSGKNTTVKENSVKVSECKCEENCTCVSYVDNCSQDDSLEDTDILKVEKGEEIRFKEETRRKEHKFANSENEDSETHIPVVIPVLILIIYILLGALMYSSWEDWNFLDSLYFVFISISTIGFGDVTPAHTKYFIVTSVYVFIGLSLVSMCINVFIQMYVVSYKAAKHGFVMVKSKVKCNFCHCGSRGQRS